MLQDLFAALMALLLAWLLSIGAMTSAQAQTIAPTTCNETVPAIFEAAAPAVVLIDGTSINPYRRSTTRREKSNDEDDSAKSAWVT